MLATSALFHPHAVAAVANKPVDEVRRRAARTLLAAVGSLLGGYLFALFAVHGLWVRGDQPTVTAGFNAFALLFVMSLAIERVIAPIAPILGPDSTVAKAKLLTAQAVVQRRAPAVPVPAVDGPAPAPAVQPSPPVAEVVHAEGEVADSRSKTALVTWGVATGLACVLSASLNVTLLHAMTTQAGTHSPFWVDLLVTGLVIGAGTKPLNDLWSRLQNKP
jgi:hypothetical protein